MKIPNLGHLEGLVLSIIWQKTQCDLMFITEQLNARKITISNKKLLSLIASMWSRRLLSQKSHKNNQKEISVRYQITAKGCRILDESITFYKKLEKIYLANIGQRWLEHR